MSSAGDRVASHLNWPVVGWAAMAGFVAWAVWIGWDVFPEMDGMGDSTGPFLGSWQVLGSAVTLFGVVVIVGLTQETAAAFVAYAAITAAYTAGFCISAVVADSLSTESGFSFWPIAAAVVFFNVGLGVSVVGGILSLVRRYRTTQLRHPTPQTGTELARTPPRFNTTVRIHSNPTGGWDVKEPGAQRALRHATSQREAVRLAPSLLPQGGRVQLHSGDGRLECTILMTSPERVWWEVNPVLLAAGVLLLLRSALQLSGDSSLKWLGLISLLGGLIAVLSGISSIRRRQLLKVAAADDIERQWWAASLQADPNTDVP